MSLRQIKRWVSKFKKSLTDLKDKQRPRASRTASILGKITDIITKDVGQYFKEPTLFPKVSCKIDTSPINRKKPIAG